MTPQDYKQQKPFLSTDGQIDHLINKGVKFNYITEPDARKYLEENNNYFRLRAYRKNFDKHPGGVNEGKYIDLDFAMLVDLSVIDMRLRYTLLELVLDVEHFSKIKLLRKVTEANEDGYSIVEDYFTSLKNHDIANSTTRHTRLINELDRNRDNPYCGGIIEKYSDSYPIWAFIEVIPLGSFIHFYEFCADRLKDRRLKDIAYLLKTVKDLRNAAAHSNCLLNDMRSKNRTHIPDKKMMSKMISISEKVRNKRMKNERTLEITTLLYAHSLIVTSEGVHKRAKADLHEIADRMYRHIDYYKNNELILTNFDFFKKTVDIFFK